MNAPLKRVVTRMHAMPTKFPRRSPRNLVPTRNWHFQWLADHMRVDEVTHFLAITGARDYDPDVAALACMNTSGLRFTLMGEDGFPVVAGGAHQTSDGEWTGWMVGTMPGWGSHWRSVTKASLWLMGQLFEMGARRISVTTISSRTAATEWYTRALGMFLSDTSPGWNGETLVTFSRMADVA